MTIPNLFDAEVCIDCDKPCHLGSTRFVNRYPCWLDYAHGYRCGDCAAELDAEFAKEHGWS